TKADLHMPDLARLRRLDLVPTERPCDRQHPALDIEIVTVERREFGEAESRHERARNERVPSRVQRLDRFERLARLLWWEEGNVTPVLPRLAPTLAPAEIGGRTRTRETPRFRPVARRAHQLRG